MDTTTNVLEEKALEQNAPENMPESAAECGSSVCQTESQEDEANSIGPIYVPAVDLVEGENLVNIIADIPGVADGGVELTVEKNVLTLVAKPEELTFEGRKLAYSEYGIGEYHCSFSLSDEIDKEEISASLKDGVLTISLPKRVPVAKKISVAIS